MTIELITQLTKSIPPWYSSIIASAFTGLFTVLAVFLTQRSEEKRFRHQEQKNIRDERKIAYKDLLSIAIQIEAFQGKDDPLVSKEFYKSFFNNLAELSLIGSPKVNSKINEIKLRYPLLEENDFYAFFTSIKKELSPLMYDEMNYPNNERDKHWWQFWK